MRFREERGVARSRTVRLQPGPSVLSPVHSHHGLLDAADAAALEEFPVPQEAAGNVWSGGPGRGGPGAPHGSPLPPACSAPAVSALGGADVAARHSHPQLGQHECKPPNVQHFGVRVSSGHPVHRGPRESPEHRPGTRIMAERGHSVAGAVITLGTQTRSPRPASPQAISPTSRCRQRVPSLDSRASSAT